MKNPLRYQVSEYDCGPTSMLNAVSYLFAREEIQPEILRNIMIYSLDCYGQSGVLGQSGTSRMAMMFLSRWLSGVGEAGLLPIECQYLSGKSVYLGEQSLVVDALNRGGVVVMRLYMDGEHYVLLTKREGENIYLFDPYYMTENPFGSEIEFNLEQPCRYNRIVPFACFNREEAAPYALGKVAEREAVLLFDTRNKLTAERTIEYFI
ncbi:MAG: peptidase C39 [Selenomonas sp.]|nr:peptidase C39 [Selenomonas sp.]